VRSLTSPVQTTPRNASIARDMRPGPPGSSPPRKRCSSTQPSTTSSAAGVSRSDPTACASASTASTADGTGRLRQGTAPRVETLLGVRQQVRGPRPVLAVGLRKDRQSNSHRIDSGLTQLRHEDEVAQRLAHLLAVVGHHRRVDVVAGERPPLEHFALRGAHLVVREDQVPSAALQVEPWSQQVRARSSRTRCAIPDGPVPADCPRTGGPPVASATAADPPDQPCQRGPGHPRVRPRSRSCPRPADD
jgi:hypothetical protein